LRAYVGVGLAAVIIGLPVSAGLPTSVGLPLALALPAPAASPTSSRKKPLPKSLGSGFRGAKSR